MTTDSVKMYISEKNLIHNVEYLTSAFHKKIIAVVKSNAYGHGINLITETLYRHGYKNFAVAHLNEAEKILLNLKLSDSRILIFGNVEKEKLSSIKNKKAINISINSFKGLEDALEIGIPSERMHLSFDFGFGRSGISLDSLEKIKMYIEKYNLKFGGIYSHLFSVKYDDGLKIIKKFTEIVEYFGKERFEMIHLQSSVPLKIFGSLDIATHIRVGTYIYGLQEKGIFDENLKQVFFLEGKVYEVKNLENSEYLAYDLKSNLGTGNCRHTVKVKMGYGDGFLKINQKTKCLIKDKLFNIAFITMGDTFIEADSSVKVGDRVIFYPDVLDICSQFNMSMYELLTILNVKIERVLV